MVRCTACLRGGRRTGDAVVRPDDCFNVTPFLSSGDQAPLLTSRWTDATREPPAVTSRATIRRWVPWMS